MLSGIELELCTYKFRDRDETKYSQSKIQGRYQDFFSMFWFKGTVPRQFFFSSVGRFS